MKKRGGFYFLLFTAIVLCDVLLLGVFEERITEYSDTLLSAVWEDMVYFPVPASLNTEEAGISYVDSFMQSRTFGGDRHHEGCDIMADKNTRGAYPVISISDGVVEKIGWLKLGGYRIGIRSEHGVYFYYAHLSDYAPDMAEGVQVRAGELLGFMGDTGYSIVEGTTGNFPVHLHVGIYLNGKDGTEQSYDPYPFLQSLEAHKLSYAYEVPKEGGT